jgi:outer membrane protein assembly factor BamD (BamD/ComL family)
MAVAIASLALLVWTAASSPAVSHDDTPKAEAATKDDPLAAARAATNREEWNEAAEKFQAFVDAHPSAPQAPEARFWTGFCQVKLGENEKAVVTMKPFTDALADDKWADDALLQIGKAYHALGNEDDALKVWKRHLEKYPQSVWRTEVSLAVIDVLFFHASDLAACLSYCERLTEEVQDRDSTTEARYLGAYCLNALRKFDASEAWADRLFNPDSPLEEAWRRLLGAQRDLLRGRVESALTGIDALATDFPDLDHDSRQDLLLRTSYVLRFNGRADRARELLQAELLASSARSQEDVDAILDELEGAFGEDRESDYLATLSRLTSTPKAPIVVRVSARDRQAATFKEAKHTEKAEALLREAMLSETAEFARFRAALKLAEIVAEEPARREDAIKVLEQLGKKLKRRDLKHQLGDAAERYRKQVEEASSAEK